MSTFVRLSSFQLNFNVEKSYKRSPSIMLDDDVERMQSVQYFSSVFCLLYYVKTMTSEKCAPYVSSIKHPVLSFSLCVCVLWLSLFLCLTYASRATVLWDRHTREDSLFLCSLFFLLFDRPIIYESTYSPIGSCISNGLFFFFFFVSTMSC